MIIGGGSAGGGASPIFTDNITFMLSGGKSFGKYLNGQTSDWIGKTAIEAIVDAAIEYIAPSWSSFSIAGQAVTVEIGTIISGSKTFTWGLNQNSGVISGIDIYHIMKNDPSLLEGMNAILVLGGLASVNEKTEGRDETTNPYLDIKKKGKSK